MVLVGGHNSSLDSNSFLGYKFLHWLGAFFEQWAGSSPMNETELASEAARGRRAAILLEDPIFREAVLRTQQQVFDDFAKCDPTDLPGLQRLRLKLQCHADILRDINEVIRTGKIADHQMKESATLFERMKRGIRA